jgi:hypothetical protein
MHKNSHKTALFLIFFTGSVSVNASEPQQQSSKGVLSGSLAVLSQYIYRGGIENDQPNRDCTALHWYSYNRDVLYHGS